jgi:hypothetical protein
MLRKRRIKPNLIARVLSFSNLVESKVCKNHNITPAELTVLVCAHTLQFEINQFVTPGALRARSGLSRGTVVNCLSVLCELGFMSLVSRGSYNVSVSGGYVVRSLVTELTRCLNDSVFSLWVAQGANNPELAPYFEPSVIEMNKRKNNK